MCIGACVVQLMKVYISLSPEDLVEIVSQTAVPLDPVYTLKGVRGMLGELRDNPSSFSGKRILYIHTGVAIYT